MGWKESCLVGTKKTIDAAVRLVGPLFVILGTALISAVIVVHYRAIIPFYGAYSSPTGIIHLCISTFLSMNLYFNYYMIVFTPPGTTAEIVRN